MSDVFISYSRKDKVFARRLFERLKQENYTSWMDWAKIQGGGHWWNDIREGIEGANNFVFIITPDSYSSGICHREIEHALLNNKRIIPIVRREVSKPLLAGKWIDQEWEGLARSNFDKLAELDYVFFRKKSGFDCQYDEDTKEVTNPECDSEASDADDFETAFAKLLAAIMQDPTNARLHTRYLLRAKEWADNQRQDSLLIGEEIGEAEAWLSNWEQVTEERRRQDPPLRPLEPQPLPLHRQYIAASRAAEIDRTRRLRNIRRASVIGITLAVVATVFAIAASLIGVEANNAANQAAIRELQANQGATQAIESANQAATRELQANQAATQAVDSANQAGTREAQANVGATQAVDSANQAAARELQANLAVTQAVDSANIARVTLAAANVRLTEVPPVLTRAGEQIVEAQATAERILAEGESSVLINYARQAENSGDPLLALALAVEANRLPDPPSISQQYLADISLKPNVRWVSAEAHYGGILKMVLSPNGSRLATTSYDGTTILWDASSGQPLKRVTGCCSAAFLDDTSLLTSAFNGDTGQDVLVLWDSETLEERDQLTGHRGTITAVATRPESQRFMSADDTGYLIVWDRNTLTSLFEYQLDDLTMTALDVSADGRLGVVAAYRTLSEYNQASKFFVLDLESGDVIGERDIGSGIVGAAVISPDGKLLYTGIMSGGAISKWSLPDLELLDGYTHPSGLGGLSLNASGEYLLSYASGSDLENTTTFIVWDTATGEPIIARQGWYSPNVFEGTIDAGITAALWHPNSTQIYTAGNVASPSVALWDLLPIVGGRYALFDSSSGGLIEMALSPDGNVIAMGGFTLSEGAFLGLSDGSRITRELQSSDSTGTVDSLNFTQDSQHLVTSSDSSAVLIWEVNSDAAPRVLRDPLFPDAPLEKAILSADDQFIFTTGCYAAASGTTEEPCQRGILRWDYASGAVLERYDPGDLLTIREISITADNRTLIISGQAGSETEESDDRVLILYDMLERNVVFEERVPGQQVTTHKLSPNQDWIAEGLQASTSLLKDEYTIEIRRVTDGQLVQTLLASDYVQDIEFTRDQRYLLASGCDNLNTQFCNIGEVTLWDVSRGEVISRTYITPADQNTSDLSSESIIRDIFLSPDEDLVYAIGDDGYLTVRFTAIAENLLRQLPKFRYIRPFSCQERQAFNVLSPCVDDVLPTVIPLLTPTPTPTPVSVNEIAPEGGLFRGEVPEGGSQEWQYMGRQGDMLSIMALADNAPSGDALLAFDPIFQAQNHWLDTRFIVIAPDGSIIGEADDSQGLILTTDASLFNLTLPQDGLYRVIVSSPEFRTQGGYSLMVTVVKAPS